MVKVMKTIIVDDITAIILNGLHAMTASLKAFLEFQTLQWVIFGELIRLIPH